MVRRSFLWRLFLGYAALIVLVAVVFISSVTPGLRGAYESDTERALGSHTGLLSELARPTLEEMAGASGLTAVDEEAALRLQQRLQETGASTGIRLTVVLNDGTVIADSAEDPAQMSNHATRPELLEAATTGYGHNKRYSRTLGFWQMYVAQRLDVEGQQIGLVRASQPLDAIDQRIFELLQRVVFSAAVALAVALLLGWFVGRRITGPLRRVSAAVADLERGDYSRRIHVDSDDEIGALASTINHLGESLGERIAEIRRDRNETLSILASMTEGVIAVDPDERILQMNAAAAAMLRIEAEPSLGMHFWEAVRVSEICSMVTKVVRDQETADLEIRTSVALGDRELELHGNRMFSLEGETAGAVLVVRDVTELRRLENIRTEFVSNVSHELKTPLTVISGLVESILHDPEMEESTRQRFMVRVHAQAQRLSDLVRDLLSLSRAERLMPKRDHQALDLRTSLRESISAIEPLTDEKGLQLEVDIPDSGLPVRADMESLRQVFDNLLSNACRYTSSEGRISVKAREADGRVTVEIADTGIGIDERQQERVFERFYRADSARSRELGGTGLGLAIVKHVVHGLGGDVQLQSEPGVGSVFTIGIPTATQAAETE